MQSPGVQTQKMWFRLPPPAPIYEDSDMGYMRHHAIVATSCFEDRLQVAQTAAVEIFGDKQVTSIIGPTINRYYSFFVGPDGSKEGWEESARGNDKRDEFVDWLQTQSDEDGCNYIDWAEIQYGDDGKVDLMTRSSSDPGNLFNDED